MASYTEADIQYILLYWDVPKWTTKPNEAMVKELVRNFYTNGAALLTTLGSGEHGMLRNFMSAVLYIMVSGTLFANPTTPVLNIPQTPTRWQHAT